MARRDWDEDCRAPDVPPGAVPLDDVVRDPQGTLRLLVTRNARGDPLGALWARRQIAEHQFAAGRRWQMLLEQAGAAGVRAHDPARERVDGGARKPDGPSDGQLIAARELRRVERALGTKPAAVLRLVLAEGLSIAEVAEAMGMPSARGRDRLGWLVRLSLDELAVGFGYAGR